MFSSQSLQSRCWCSTSKRCNTFCHFVHVRPALNHLEISKTYQIVLETSSQYPPFTRSCSPARRVDRGEGWQTHGSWRWRWRCRSSQHGHYLKHHNLEEGGTEILWIIFTWGCWPAYGTLLESSCQKRIPRLYTSQALLGTSPFNNSGAW